MKRVFKFILDFVEVYLPVICFASLFIIFMLGIIFRYFFEPLTWTLELTLICFIWTSLLGGLYAKRDDSHVMFTLIYDAVTPGKQRIMRLVGNSLLLFSFALGLVPSIRYIMFMGYKKSNVLKIPMDLAFSPFAIFLSFMIGRFAVDIYKDIVSFRKKETGKR